MRWARLPRSPRPVLRSSARPFRVISTWARQGRREQIFVPALAGQRVLLFPLSPRPSVVRRLSPRTSRDSFEPIAPDLEEEMSPSSERVLGAYLLERILRAIRRRCSKRIAISTRPK